MENINWEALLMFLLGILSIGVAIFLSFKLVVFWKAAYSAAQEMVTIQAGILTVLLYGVGVISIGIAFIIDKLAWIDGEE